MLSIQRTLKEAVPLTVTRSTFSNRIAYSCMKHPRDVPVQTLLASTTLQSLRLLLQVRTDCRRFGHVNAKPDMENMHRVSHQGWTTAFLGLGSNVGDRFANIEKACRALETQDNIKLLRTSGLWETEPMYVTDQNRFLNGACEVSFSESTLNTYLMRLNTAKAHRTNQR